MTRPKWASDITPCYSLRVRGCIYEVNPDGTLGTLWLFRIVGGRQHVQRWRKSDGGNTPLVQANRRRFAAAMAAWKELTEEEKKEWEEKAKRRYKYCCVRYNAFVADYIKSHDILEFL